MTSSIIIKFRVEFCISDDDGYQTVEDGLLKRINFRWRGTMILS